jgi:ParB-like chromosome segregation protein Spo0J
MSDNDKQVATGCNPDLVGTLEELLSGFPDRMAAVEALREALHRLSPNGHQPIDRVRWVPIDRVQANDYNPNSVAKNEMHLLYTSIKADGYTQPIVTIYDPEIDKYVIVDGFHRYTTMRVNQDIRDWCNGFLPVVVIDKPINDRMASTVRHNRARGKHSVSGMANMVFQMLENGWDDAAICAELGLEADELMRLKHVTGFSKLFEDVEYRKAWETGDQIKLRIEQERIQQAVRRSKSSGQRKAKDGSVSGGEDSLDETYARGTAPVAVTNEDVAAREDRIQGLPTLRR